MVFEDHIQRYKWEIDLWVRLRIHLYLNSLKVGIIILILIYKKSETQENMSNLQEVP